MLKLIKRLSIVFVFCCFILGIASCTPKNATDARSKMEDKGYTVTVVSTDDVGLVKAFVGVDIESIVNATKSTEDATETVTAIYFSSKDDAKSAEAKVKEYYEKQGKKVENFKRSGKVIFFGTDKAFKDFK